MKKRIGIPIFLAVLFIFACQTSAQSIWIMDVNVIPEQPLLTDTITINLSGWASNTPSWVEYDQFSQNGTSLQLDLHIDMGNWDTLSQWSYAKQIGSLVPGTYSLTVQAFVPIWFPNGPLQDTYTTEFTVTPEPTTLVLLAIGLPIIRGFL